MTHSFPESLSAELRVALFFHWVGLEKKSSPVLTSDNLIIQRFVSRINRHLSGGPSPFRGSGDLYEASKCLLLSLVTALWYISKLQDQNVTTSYWLMSYVYKGSRLPYTHVESSTIFIIWHVAKY